MVWFLARRNLRRSLSRTALLVAGVTMAGALLFDMSMLGRGLETSFAEVLGRLGYEIRVTLHGTLPLSSEASIPRASEISRRIAAHPNVAWTGPVVATNLYVSARGRRISAIALGIPEEASAIYITDGARGETPDPRGLVVNHTLAQALSLTTGSRVRLSTQIAPQTGAPRRSEPLNVQAVADFVFDLRGARTLSLPAARLQELLGLRSGEASFLIVKLREEANADAVVRWIEEMFPTLDAFSIVDLQQQARQQLTYFNHFATILSGVSLLVAFLLIGAVLTLAVGERLGELAILRAIGLPRFRLVALVLAEGVVLAATSAPLALLLGAAAGGPLDAILRSAPGIPQDLHFFVMTPEAGLRTVALLLVTGTIGASYPAWIAGRLNIAATLHQEVQ